MPVNDRVAFALFLGRRSLLNLSLLLCSAGSVSAVPAISAIVAPASVSKYEKYQITFNISGSVAANLQWAYDASAPPGVTSGQGISVDAQFSPNNWTTVYSQPAFWYQPFDYQVKNGRDWIYPQGNPVWMVRFAPNVAGHFV
jgi:hypothetical protein